MGKRVTALSLLVVLGVRRDGQKILRTVKTMGGETEAAWRAVLDDLIACGLKTPELVIVDGGKGGVTRLEAKEAETREAILAGLEKQLAKGDKVLVGNSAYRRFLKTPRRGHFEIDQAKVAEEACFGGIYVLRTNTRLSPLRVMLRYRDLPAVEQLFRTAKSLLPTRPIYHQPSSAAEARSD